LKQQSTMEMHPSRDDDLVTTKAVNEDHILYRTVQVSSPIRDALSSNAWRKKVTYRSTASGPPIV